VKRGVAILLLVVAVAAGLWVLARRPAHPVPSGDAQRPPKFLIVGIDSLDWDLVQELVARGRMPNMARLMEDGASGILRSIPPFHSPDIWTCIATGKSDEKHGITGYTAGGDDVVGGPLATSNLRRAKALWNIFSSAERTVGVIGWLITFPAEPVNGYTISDNTVFLIPSELFVGAKGQVFEDMRKGVYPPELWDEVAGLRVAEATLPEEETSGLLGARVPAGEVASRLLISLKRFTAGDLAVVNLVTHLAVSRPTDFTAVYLRGTDLVSHFFWRFKDPDSWGRAKLSAAAIKAFGPVVDRYYEKTDAMLGEILKTRDDDTIVIVCSDHGFAGHRGYPGFKGDVAIGSQAHRAEGTIILAGPGIVRGKRIEGATVYDIAPTILVLAGLPVGRDMDGRPLVEAIAPSYLKVRPVASIETYETEARTGEQEPVASPVDDETKEMLRSLGYIK
jgi:hypothetical protein